MRTEIDPQHQLQDPTDPNEDAPVSPQSDHDALRNSLLLFKVRFLFEMENVLCTEKMSSTISSPLPKWIIEYAFTKRMIDVLGVLGPPPWFKGDRGCQTPKDPCSIRVAAAEAWMIVRTRQVQHFEKVLKLMDHFYTLLPQLVTPIKHMKIMFGLKTLIIMWMFGEEQSLSDINHKILKFFPDSLPQYHRSSRRHMELMQKTQKDFRTFAQSLARNGEWRKTYIQDFMKDQYGELYTMKLEERLSLYLDLLNKALLQPSYIDQVLNRSWPLEGSDELLQQLLTCDEASQSKALKRLLKCVVMPNNVESMTTSKQHNNAADVYSRPSSTERSSLMKLDGGERTRSEGLKGQIAKNSLVGKEDDSPGVLSSSNLCSRHGKKMKTILQECSEELRVQDGEGDLMPTAETSASSQTHSHPRLTQDSASSLQDSSSTNISQSSNLDCFSNLDDGQKFLSSESSSQPDTSPTARLQSKSSASLSHELNVGILTQISFSSTSSPVSPFSGCSPLPFSSSSSSASFPKNQMTQVARSPASPTSLPEKDSSMVPLTQHHISPIESSSASIMETLSQISAQLSQPKRHGVVSECSDGLKSKLKLSLETQSYLLLCKWLQPRVKLYRLRDCDPTTGQPPTEKQDDEEEEKVFDVNLLYSGSESDAEDSDDPDYRPSKKVKM